MYKLIKLIPSPPKGDNSIPVPIDRTVTIYDGVISSGDEKFLYEAGGVIEPRDDGEFKDRAFFLDPRFDWIIGKDSRNHIILIPLKKEV